MGKLFLRNLSPKALVILCDGGLANRLNSLIVGLYFRRYLDCNRCIVIWPVSDWCKIEASQVLDLEVLGGVIDDVVESVDASSLLPITHMPGYFQHSKALCLYNPFAFFFGRLFSKISKFHYNGFLVASDLLPFWLLRNKKLIEIEEMVFKSLSSKIDLTKIQINLEVGVHIRQTDFPNKKKIFDKAFNKISILVEKYKYIHVYTDSDETLDALARKWPKLIYKKTSKPIYEERKIIRNSDSVLAAIEDLVELSNCKVIIRTSNSSFLDLAIRFSRLNNIKSRSYSEFTNDFLRKLSFSSAQLKKLLR